MRGNLLPACAKVPRPYVANRKVQKAVKALLCKIYNLAFLAALKSENNIWNKV